MPLDRYSLDFQSYHISIMIIITVGKNLPQLLNIPDEFPPCDFELQEYSIIRIISLIYISLADTLCYNGIQELFIIFNLLFVPSKKPLDKGSATVFSKVDKSLSRPEAKRESCFKSLFYFFNEQI